MTIGEAKNAKDFVRGFNRFKTISVWQHKTAAQFGSAKVVLPYKVYELLLKYMEKYRPEATDEDLIFVSPATGERIQRVAGVLEQLSAHFGKKVSYAGAC